MTEVHGIPVTTLARTLLDLASVLDRQGLERAIHEADARRLTGPLSLEDLLVRHRHARGACALTRILAAGHAGADVTRSELEDRFLAFLDAGGASASSREHDDRGDSLPTRGRLRLAGSSARRRARRHATHATRRGFERDRARDRALATAGWRVVRLTWRQLHEEGEAIAADLCTLLGD